MTPRQLMQAAMRREPTERIPAMPQICHDVAVRIASAEDHGDWRQGMRRCAEQPEAIYEHVIDLARRVGADGLRLFVASGPARLVAEGDDVAVLDGHTGEHIGRLDLLGGGQVVPDHAPGPVGTVEQAERRLNAMADQFTDDKLGMLQRCRASVPDLFVASSPGSITMDTYMALRGREQALFDLVERRDFVSAVMELQVRTMIRRAEKLVRTGIDALYIGDPSASASLISPQHFERFCLPGYQAFCNHFKSTDVLIYLHICGDARPILEMMADSGADAIEPLDPMGGVDAADAKARVGDKVALMGGVSPLTLSQGTPEQVRSEAIRKCYQAGPTGYILAAGDMVPPDTPLANLQAMVDVARCSLWVG